MLYKFVEVRLAAWLLSKLGATKMDGIGCSPKVHTHKEKPISLGHESSDILHMISVMVATANQHPPSAP